MIDGKDLGHRIAVVLGITVAFITWDTVEAYE
jgi:hypothetical protein